MAVLPLRNLPIILLHSIPKTFYSTIFKKFRTDKTLVRGYQFFCAGVQFPHAVCYNKYLRSVNPQKFTTWCFLQYGNVLPQITSRYMGRFSTGLPCNTAAKFPYTWSNTWFHPFALSKVKEWKDMLDRSMAQVSCMYTLQHKEHKWKKDHLWWTPGSHCGAMVMTTSVTSTR